MTATQSFRIHEIPARHFNNSADARAVVEDIEQIVAEKFTSKQEALATKQDIGDLRREMAENKVDIIKWIVGFNTVLAGTILAVVKLL